ncbi:MAG TPA: regulatory iron-sulfur-containing complex subunit RicT [Anaerolineae bacterium]|nr:regulatory iron-sulfur-containing complex subunit RicT [Anaerolineae bacterium]
MPLVVGVRFRPVTKIYYFDPTPFDEFQVDDRVIVETSRGIELGMVALATREVPKSEIKSKLKRVIRPATPVDLMQAENFKAQEPVALEKCSQLVAEMNIPIKVLQAEYSFDGTRLLFSFISEQRVDFRDLVKELARALRTRIEMKQVGARDETKILDGYGRCGRRLCCSSWLTDFHPVSIRMAKLQGLPLAPAEISGLCGRLLCCLAYEDEMYAEMKKELPKVGSQVKTAQGGVAIVRGLNIIKEALILEMEGSEAYTEVKASEVQPIQGDSRSREKREPSQPTNKPADENNNGE